MKKDNKLDLWIYLGIPILGVIAFFCYSPPLSHPAHAAVYNAHTSSVALASQSGTPSINTNNTLAPKTSVLPSDFESETPPTPRVCVFDVQTSYSQLRQCLDATPTTIYGLTAINGQNVVIAHTTMGDTVVNIPDNTAKNVLAEKALSRNLSFDVQSTPFNLLTWVGDHIWIVLIVASILLTAFLQWRQQKAQQSAAQTKLLKSKAKDFREIRKGPRLTFDDIRGCDEAVDHARRITEMHEHQVVYKAHKAPYPRGFLLVGQPGVGKTHWVRVLADVLDGDVFITAGSEFVEMFVGVGASRARDLVEQAKARARESTKPVLVMIDEIDAVAAKRGISGGGGSDEREQTLNQLLVLMDGMEELENIIFIGATNLPEKLDPAILRRLPHRINIDLPDLKGRADIIDLYIKKLTLGGDVSVPALAKSTYSMSGDQLKKGVEYASSLAARRCVMQRKANKVHRNALVEVSPVTMSDFARAFDYIMYGDELPSKQAGLSKLNKRNTSLHEACHLAAALIFYKLGWIDKPIKATIMMRSRTLGFVLTMPEGERTGWNHRECFARMIMAMAGRAGQEVFLDTRDSGASGDFQQATDMAREMAMQWGMTDVGSISIGQRRDGTNIQTGLAVANDVDKEWIKLCNDCMDVAMKLVKAEVKRIKVFTLVLEAEETILENAIDKLAEAVASEFDAAVLPMFEKLKAFEEQLFDNCDIGPVEKYLQLMAPAAYRSSSDDNGARVEVLLANATTAGDTGDNKGEALTTGVLA